MANGFYYNWIYPGTVVFLRQSELPPAMKEAMLKLCRSGKWYEPAAADQVFAENDSALKAMEVANPRAMRYGGGCGTRQPPSRGDLRNESGECDRKADRVDEIH